MYSRTLFTIYRPHRFISLYRMFLILSWHLKCVSASTERILSSVSKHKTESVSNYYRPEIQSQLIVFSGIPLFVLSYSLLIYSTIPVFPSIRSSGNPCFLCSYAYPFYVVIIPITSFIQTLLVFLES